jgi:small conductance mechanosensitive channel
MHPVSATFVESFLQFWNDYRAAIHVTLIAVGALVLRTLLLASVKRVVQGVVTGVRGKNKGQEVDESPLAKARVVQRTRTIGSVLGNFITWGITLVAVIMVLAELGVAVGGLIAGAGIIGAALGFGAQSLVKDLISGLFIVFEDQFGVGDSVDLGEASGVVETVGLRVTQIRDLEGTLWYVRNGEIIRVGNSSQGWSRVVLDVAIGANQNIEKAIEAISAAASKLAKHPQHKSDLLGEAEVWGVQDFDGDQVVIRLAQQVSPKTSDAVQRELRSEIIEALQKAKVQLAPGRQAIFVKQSK